MFYVAVGKSSTKQFYAPVSHSVLGCWDDFMPQNILDKSLTSVTINKDCLSCQPGLGDFKSQIIWEMSGCLSQGVTHHGNLTKDPILFCPM